MNEILEERKSNEKTFVATNGRMIKEIYANTIHSYKNGLHDNIDNNLVLKQSESYPFDFLGYENLNNNYRVRFAKDGTKTIKYAIEKDGHSLVWEFIKANQELITADETSIKTKAVKSLTEIINTNSELTYKNVYADVDLKYLISNDKVKDYIVINSKKDSYSYKFKLALSNLSVELSENSKSLKFISLKENDDKVVFTTPAPIIIDGNENETDDAWFELTKLNENQYELKIEANAEFINDDKNELPIIIDPAIKTEIVDETTFNKRKYYDKYMNHGYDYIGHYTSPSSSAGSSNHPYERLYYKLDLSQVNINGYIDEVKFVVTIDGTAKEYYAMVGETDKNLDTTIKYYCEPDEPDVIDYEKISANTKEYKFDITPIVNRASQNDENAIQFVLKGLDENVNNPDLQVSDAKIEIVYKTGHAVQEGYTVEQNAFGRAGVGKINLFTGNVKFVHSDFVWKGNKMPVSISHSYSNGDYINSDSSEKMTFGCGWKLNILQTITEKTEEQPDGTSTGERYYEYIDENGNKHRLNKKDETNDDIYVDKENVAIEYNKQTKILSKNNLECIFNAYGNIQSIKNAYNIEQIITYNTEQQISSVTDGAGRTFSFTFVIDKLTKIEAPNNEFITYTYSNDVLTKITHSDGYTASFEYIYGAIGEKNYCYLSKVINGTSSTDSLYLQYEYNDKLSNNTPRINTLYKARSAKEKFGNETSNEKLLEYCSNLITKVKTHTPDENVNATTTYIFKDDGYLLQRYIELDNEQKNNAMSVNLIKNHAFNENTHWNTISTSGNISTSSYEPYHGKKSLVVSSQGTCDNYAYQDVVLPAGSYTFSVFVRAYRSGGCSYIKVKKDDQVISSRYFYSSATYERISCSFYLTHEQSIRLELGNCGCCTTYFNAPQLENALRSNKYNYLNNGNFEIESYGWEGSNVLQQTFQKHNMSKSGKICGDIISAKSIYQYVDVCSDRDIKEEFAFSGWAKSYVPINKERELLGESLFELRAIIEYYNGVVSDEFSAQFARNTYDWQYASLTFSKKKFEKIKNIKLAFVYDNNVSDVYIDDFQLVRNGMPMEVKYEDFTEQMEENEEDIALELGDFTDNSEETFVDESVDQYGNKKYSVAHFEGELGTIYRTFGYSANGNERTVEKDERNISTTKAYDTLTSKMTQLAQPGREPIVYTYENRKLKTMRANDVSTNYTYDKNNKLTEITHNGFAYKYAYNNFKNLKSISVNETFLAQIEHNTSNSKIKKITFGNGHVFNCIYNFQGKKIEESWKKDDIEYAKYKYVYDLTGALLQIIDIKDGLLKEYEYDNNILKFEKEYNITLSGESITNKTLINTISYTLNDGNKILNKTVSIGNKSYKYSYNYFNNEKGNYTLKLPNNVTSVHKKDSFGRKIFDELQLGTSCLYKKYSYVDGDVDKSILGDTLLSAPTTDLVSEISYENGDIYSYAYDEGENITEVKLNGVLKESYSYDSFGRLKTEQNVDSGFFAVYAYDNGGNTTSRTKYACTSTEPIDSAIGLSEIKKDIYVYKDAQWKDLLMSYNGQSITYDDIGNPTTYLGHALEWEKGRQLKKFGTCVYTYNATGIRTSKTINNITHSYTLDEQDIIHEEYGSTKLDYLYDIDGKVCGLRKNESESFYFKKNLQGDIIAIVNANGEEVAKYRYDAWGKCTVLNPNGTENTNVDFTGNINPFRYRSYYYDSEIEIYYLQSRYYDPKTGRFLNADSLLGVNDELFTCNLFIFCGNNPVNRVEENGMFWNWIKKKAKKVVKAVVKTVASAGPFVVGIVATPILHLASEPINDMLKIVEKPLAKVVEPVFDNLDKALTDKEIDTAALGAFFLDMNAFEWEGANGMNTIYYAKDDCWQQWWGYSDLYDTLFDIGTDMDNKKFEFKYNDEHYILWAWKGDYISLGAGAELGIYYGGDPHWLVNRNLRMPMKLSLLYHGKEILSREATTWWITGFNPAYKYDVLAKDLTANYTVDFPNRKMYNAFIHSKDAKNIWESPEKNKATYSF